MKEIWNNIKIIFAAYTIKLWVTIISLFQRLKSIGYKLRFLLILYPIAFWITIIFFFQRLIGRIKIVHPERFPKHWQSPELFENGLIVVCNHVSLIDPFLVTCLFGDQYLVNPFKFAPYNIAEIRNYNKWYWKWAEQVIIWVERGNKQSMRAAFRKSVKVVNSGKILVIHVEGGRTSSASEKDLFYSPKKRKKLRHLKEGIASLIKRTKAPVFFIWIDDSDKVMPNLPGRLYSFPRLWNKVVIKIGEIVRFDSDLSREEITQRVVTRLLDLADEEE